jgi:mxaA protein
MNSSRNRRCVSAMLMLFGTIAVQAKDPTVLEGNTREPRAFGYQVGDVVQRRVTVWVPAGLTLDEATLPRPGARGKALELRALQRRVVAEGVRREEEIVLDYQVFLAPPAVRTLEMPPFTLRYDGAPRAQELRVDAWPVTVAPLVAVEAPSRTGLGELQPDQPPPLIDTGAGRLRLIAFAVVLAALLAYLAVVYLGLPWWGTRRRPFGLAWREVRHLPPTPSDAAWRAACQQMHAALNQSAGEVLFEQNVERFAARRPAFAALRADIVKFLHLSRRVFFAGAAQAPGDAAWLVGFCRRCRDAERGS